MKHLTTLLLTLLVLGGCGVIEEELQRLEESKVKEFKFQIDYSKNLIASDCHKLKQFKNLKELSDDLDLKRSKLLIQENKEYIRANLYEYERLCNQSIKSTTASVSNVPDYIRKAHSEYRKRHQGYKSSFLPRPGQTRGDDYRNCIDEGYSLNEDAHNFCAWHSGVGPFK